MRLRGLALVLLIAAAGCAKVIGADFDDAHLAEPGGGGGGGSGTGGGAGSGGLSGAGAGGAAAGAGGSSTGGNGTGGGAGSATAGAGGEAGGSGGQAGGGSAGDGGGGSGGEAGGPGDSFPIVFNEVKGNSPDFIELYNVSTEAVDLSGYGLVDADSEGQPKNDQVFRFPPGTVVDPGGYVLILAGMPAPSTAPLDSCGGPPPPCHHAVFGVQNDGEGLFLLDAVEPTRVVATFAYPGGTVARLPDGIGPFLPATPTPNASNSLLGEAAAP